MSFSFVPGLVAKTQVPPPLLLGLRASLYRPNQTRDNCNGRPFYPVRAVRCYLVRFAAHRQRCERFLFAAGCSTKELSTTTVSFWLTVARLGLWPCGLAIAALPLVSRPWTGLCWSHLMSLSSVSDHSWCYRASWWARVCSPASTICPTSSVVKRSSFGLSASASRQVFAMRSPFRVESVSALDRNENSSSTFLVFGWCLRDEVTL